MAKKSTVRIGSVDFEIKVYEDVRHPETDDPLNACILFRKSEIHIRKELSKQARFEELCHESLHGMLTTACVEIGADEAETLICSVAPVMASFLRDNWRLLQSLGDLK